MNHTEEQKVRALELLYAFTAGVAFMGVSVMILLIATQGLSCN